MSELVKGLLFAFGCAGLWVAFWTFKIYLETKANNKQISKLNSEAWSEY